MALTINVESIDLRNNTTAFSKVTSSSQTNANVANWWVEAPNTTKPNIIHAWRSKQANTKPSSSGTFFEETELQRNAYVEKQALPKDGLLLLFFIDGALQFVSLSTGGPENHAQRPSTCVCIKYTPLTQQEHDLKRQGKTIIHSRKSLQTHCRGILLTSSSVSDLSPEHSTNKIGAPKQNHRKRDTNANTNPRECVARLGCLQLKAYVHIYRCQSHRFRVFVDNLEVMENWRTTICGTTIQHLQIAIIRAEVSSRGTLALRTSFDQTASIPISWCNGRKGENHFVREHPIASDTLERHIPTKVQCGLPRCSVSVCAIVMWIVPCAVLSIDTC